MKATRDIVIRKIDKDVLARLETIAKKTGFKSREQFIRETLSQISLEDVQLEADIKFHNLMQEMLQILKNNTDIVDMNNELMECILAKGDVI